MSRKLNSLALFMILAVALLGFACSDDDMSVDGDADLDQDQESTVYEPLQCNNASCFDPNSGLTWQKEPPTRWTPWEEAIDYCDNLELEGSSEWHLPTISELRSLVRGCPPLESGGICGVTDHCLAADCDPMDETCEEYGGSCCQVAQCSEDEGPTDGCYWPEGLGGECSWYWSSSLVEGSDRSAWFISYSHAIPDFFEVEARSARCVR